MEQNTQKKTLVTRRYMKISNQHMSGGVSEHTHSLLGKCTEFEHMSTHGVHTVEFSEHYIVLFNLHA